MRPESLIALHASAVVTPAGALIFLGYAGSGKSTICRLLAGRFMPLADDAVYLVSDGPGAGVWQVADGSRRAFGGPLAEAELVGLDTIPLLAVLRLHHASETRLIPIRPRQICRHLTDAVFEITWQQRLGAEEVRGIFSTAAQIARSYPGWSLHFTLDEATPATVFRQFDMMP